MSLTTTTTTKQVALKAVNEGVMIIMDVAVEVAILSDDSTIITQRSLYALFDRVRKANDKDGLINLVSAKHIKPFVTDRLRRLLTVDKIDYYNKQNQLFSSYSVEVVPQICHAYVKAGLANVKLTQAQWNTITRAELLYKSLGTLGMVGLVRERFNWMTKSKTPLLDIFNEITKDVKKDIVNPHIDSYLNELARLKEWDSDKVENEHPDELVTLSKELIYKRLVAGSLDEVDGLSDEELYDTLLAEMTYPLLVERLSGTVALMKASDNWNDFMKSLNRVFPITLLYTDPKIL